MISGKMADFNRYYSIDPSFEAAHKFYEEYKAQPKECGEYVVIPDKLKAILSQLHDKTSLPESESTTDQGDGE